MADNLMVKEFYNPTTWRFTEGTITGTFTAKTLHEACLTLTRLLGAEKAAKAKLTILHNKSAI